MKPDLDLREYAFRMLDKAKDAALEDGEFLSTAIVLGKDGSRFEMKLFYQSLEEQVACFKSVAGQAIDTDAGAVVVISAMTLRHDGALAMPNMKEHYGVFRVLTATVISPASNYFTIGRRFTVDEEKKFHFEDKVESFTINTAGFMALSSYYERKVYRA